MAKKESDMIHLGVPSMGTMFIGTDKPDDSEPEYPCLRTRTYTDLKLPEGDFFFLGIGHVKSKSEDEEDSGDVCYSNGIEVIAIQPISSIADEKIIEKPGAPGSLEDNFDAAIKKMQDLKENESKDDSSYDDDEDEEGDDS